MNKKYRFYGFYLVLLLSLTACLTTADDGQGQVEESAKPEKEDDSLHTLVQNDNTSGLEEMFKININVNEKDNEGQTALHIAAAAGKNDISKLLLLQGADPNAQDLKGKTPLHLAVEGNHKETAGLLVDGGSDIFLNDDNGQSPVLAGFSSLEMVKALCRRENVNQGELEIGSLLHYAAQNGNSSIVNLLVSLRADVNLRNSKEQLPLDLALLDRNSVDKAKSAALLIRNGSFKPQDEKSQYFYILNNQSNVNYRFSFGQTALHIASEQGHEGIVRFLMEENADLQSRDKPGNTALHSAVRGGYRNIVSLLLEAGADVNATDYNNNVPLHMALTLDSNTDILQMLLAANADVNAKNSFGNTALHLSVTLNRDKKAAELLLDYGSVIENRNKNGNTALLEAIEKENTEIAVLLLEQGADIFARNKQNQTPISLSLLKGVTTLSWFMDSHTVNAQDNEGNSALHLAVNMDASEDVFRFLLENGAQINSRNFAGETALHLAVVKEQLPLTSQFLKQGGDLYLENNDGETPLSLAFDKGAVFTDAFLIDSVLEEEDSLEYTPLFHAVIWEKPDIVRAILAKGANKDKKSLIGSTPLHEAVKTGSLEISSILLRAGADVNSIDNHGNTPLHEIVYWNSLALAELLISAGADMDKKNLEGRSPFYEAVVNGDFEMCSYLIKQGANIDSRDSSGKTALFETIISNNYALMELLVSQGSSTQKRDNQGNTPLHVAVIVDNSRAVHYLFNMNADIFATNKQNISPLILVFRKGGNTLETFMTLENINAQDNNGNTPLHMAVAMKAPMSTIQLLLVKGADKEARNNLGQTPYDKAVSISYESALDLLQ